MVKYLRRYFGRRDDTMDTLCETMHHLTSLIFVKCIVYQVSKLEGHTFMMCHHAPMPRGQLPTKLLYKIKNRVTYRMQSLRTSFNRVVHSSLRWKIDAVNNRPRNSHKWVSWNFELWILVKLVMQPNSVLSKRGIFVQLIYLLLLSDFIPFEIAHSMAK